MFAARLSLAVALLTACGAAEPPRPVGPAAPLQLAEGSLVAYLLAWSWDGARREGDAYVFETDRGYTVGITDAHMAIGRVELVACEPARPSLGARVSSLLVPVAHAGHARVSDGSGVTSPVVESLLDPEPRLYGRGFAGPDPYCGVHVLAVPLAAEADDGFALARESLAITGYWSAPGSGERHALRGPHQPAGRQPAPPARVDQLARGAAARPRPGRGGDHPPSGPRLRRPRSREHVGARPRLRRARQPHAGRPGRGGQRRRRPRLMLRAGLMCNRRAT